VSAVDVERSFAGMPVAAPVAAPMSSGPQRASASARETSSAVEVSAFEASSMGDAPRSPVLALASAGALACVLVGGVAWLSAPREPQVVVNAPVLQASPVVEAPAAPVVDDDDDDDAPARVEAAPVVKPPVEKPPVEKPPVEKPPVGKPPVEKQLVEKQAVEKLDKRAKLARRTPPASAAPVVVKVSAPKSITWVSESGRVLGRGTATLTVPASDVRVVAVDAKRGGRTRIEVQEGKSIEYDALPRGQLLVRAKPWARVRVGEDDLGMTPLEPVSLVAGTYRLHLEYNDRTQDREVVVEAGQVTLVKSDLTKDAPESK
jgi:hypothetical protein